MLIQDKVLFSKIYNANYDHLLYTAVKIIRNFSAAEDLVNETFFILLTQFDKIQHHPNIVGWLHTVLTNLTSNELKKQSRYISIPSEKIPGTSCEDNFISFYDCLPDELSEAEKEILVLRYQDKLNCVEIANMLNISHEASRARLSRAKRHYAELSRR